VMRLWPSKQPKNGFCASTTKHQPAEPELNKRIKGPPDTPRGPFF
jgi:hypothetical protein